MRWRGLGVNKLPSIVPFHAVRFFVVISALSALMLAGCVISPRSRTAAESSSPVTLSGYTSVGGQVITIQAVDQNTGNLATLGTAISSMSGMPYTTSFGAHYTLYPWSYPAGVLANKYWSPQSIVPDLATSQGHLELFASVGAFQFPTFSQAAFNSVLASGVDPVTAPPIPTATRSSCSIRRACNSAQRHRG